MYLRVFNFRTSQAVRKYFNNEIFTIYGMKIAWATYLGTLSRLNAILIPRISAHPPVLTQCKVYRPWASFCEGMVLSKRTLLYAFNLKMPKIFSQSDYSVCYKYVVPGAYEPPVVHYRIHMCTHFDTAWGPHYMNH